MNLLTFVVNSNRFKKMRKLIGLLTAMLLCVCFVQAAKISITDNWKYTQADDERFASVEWDDSEWESVNIPHTWNAKDVVDEQRGYRRGASWYRKKLVVPAEYADKKVTLLFDGVGNKADIYLNGKHLKTHLGAYTAFTVDISGIYKPGEVNLLAVKADNSASLTEILPPVSGDFSMFGGIYRRVYLQTYNKVHFDMEPYTSVPVRIQTSSVTAQKAQVKLDANIKNETKQDQKITVCFTLLDKERNVVKTEKIKVKVKAGEGYPVSVNMNNIYNPHLWSPDSPYLYIMRTVIQDEKKETVLQEIESTLGFRWFTVEMTGFYLNGKQLKLRGAARHQDYEGLGIAIPSEVNYNDMKLLKEMGANFVRISHYPQDPEIYRACDKLGLIAWSEICIVNEVKKNKSFAHNSKEMFKEMVYQNYNHPSVVMWGAMNELWDYHTEAIQLARELEVLSKEIDPYRLSCVAFHAFTWEKPYKQASKEMFDISDINGVNVYEAWYQGNFSTIGPMFDKFRTFSTGKPRFLSEFGAGSDERIHSYAPRSFDFTPEYQLAFNREYVNEMESRPDYIGYSIWNLIDFHVDGRGDSKPILNQKGMIHSNRELKDIYYYYQACWSKKPMIHISGTDWKQRVEVCDSEINIRPMVVFSNQSQVELFHNGRSLGVSSIKNGEVEFNVPFVNGANDLIARKGDLVDMLTIDMTLIPGKLTDNSNLSQGLYINLGQDHCYFTEPIINKTWLPDQPYKKGGWGYVDGKPFDSWPGSSHDGVRNGIGANIKNSTLEPVYQTFLIGTTSYKLDVSNGVYEVTLCFAEPFNKQERKDMERSGASSDGKRVFDVLINGEMFVSSLNLDEEYGEQTAMTKTMIVNVGNGNGLDIQFHSHKGLSVVNGLKLTKLNY